MSERDADLAFAESMKEEVKPSHMRNIWNVNISSWFSHGEALLEETAFQGVHALIDQEANS